MAELYIFTPPTSASDAQKECYRHAAGVAISIPWSADNLDPNSGGWETSSGNASAGYQWSKFDNAIQRQLDMGALSVIVILGPIAFGGKNRNTPNYVFSQDWADSLGEDQLFTAAAKDYLGAGTIQPGGCAQGVDNTAFPAVWQPPFQIAWRKAFSAALTHMGAASYADKIPYIRVGGCCGGEWFPFATAADAPGLLRIPGGPRTIAALIERMLDYMAVVHTEILVQSEPFKVVQTMNGGYATQQMPYSYADRSAALACAHGFGIGMQGLKQADLAAFEKYGTESGGENVSGYTTADSMYSFTNYPQAETLEVQTSTASSPTGDNATGSLGTLLPYATDDLHATSCELYYEDWRIAYDRTHPLNAKYGQQYRDAFKAAANASGR